MNTRDFLDTLAPHEEHTLTFDLGHGRIHPGYHVTEIKAVSVQGMDCGGQGDAWSETVVQLWTPGGSTEENTKGNMHVSKFLSIYHRVASQIPVAGEAEVRLEYGDNGEPAISYFVSEVQVEGREVVVRLEPPFVVCKELERCGGDFCNQSANLNNLSVISPASECCTPAPAQNSAEQTTCCD